MNSIDEIKTYNEGLSFPKNYYDTYIATKHIQTYDIEFTSDILNKFKDELVNKKFFIDDENVLRDIVVGLIKGNIILQGPPGTGKTTLSTILCDIFNVQSSIITAVSDWTTYDTIGGYQPSVNEDGDEIITGKNGRIVESILNCCNTIVNNVKYDGEKQATWLIIDELNRSEIDKVFGDLFTVFGSDDESKKYINLWFEKDDNKKILYVPNRYRMIGVMNNIDKNFIYDISQGLSRRFTFITINPPKIEKFDEEIANVKEIVKNKIINKFVNKSGFSVNDQYLENLFNDEIFKKEEEVLKDFLKFVRYDMEATDGISYLGLSIGTAQIIDVYETTIINLIVTHFDKLTEVNEKKVLLLEVIDSVLASIIVPQMDGFIYEKLSAFFDSMKTEYSFFVNTIDSISKLI